MGPRAALDPDLIPDPYKAPHLTFDDNNIMPTTVTFLGAYLQLPTESDVRQRSVRRSFDVPPLLWCRLLVGLTPMSSFRQGCHIWARSSYVLVTGGRQTRVCRAAGRGSQPRIHPKLPDYTLLTACKHRALPVPVFECQYQYLTCTCIHGLLECLN